MSEKYCPDWIFDAVCAEVAARFLNYDLSLTQIAQKFSRSLSISYAPIDVLEIQTTSELLLSFLSELNAGDQAVQMLCGYLFFRVQYKSNKLRRNLNSSFFDPEAGTSSREYNGYDTLKSFRAYVYAIRAGVEMPSNPNFWLAYCHELPTISKASRDLTGSFGVDIIADETR